MNVRELIEKLQAMPPDAKVERMTWCCGGETHYDNEESQEVAEVMPPGNTESPASVVLR